MISFCWKSSVFTQFLINCYCVLYVISLYIEIKWRRYMSLSHLSPFTFLLQAPLSSHAVPQKTICLVAQLTLQGKSSLCGCIPAFISDDFFWLLLRLSKVAKICHPSLQSNKIPLQMTWTALLSLPCSVSWDCPSCLSASYSHLVPWSCRALPRVLWMPSTLCSYKPVRVQAGPSLLPLLTFVSALS